MTTRPTILFVCIENSCRSQMAEALTRLHAGGIVEVYSAGSRPSGLVNATAALLMKELGYDLTTHRSKGIDELPRQQYDYIVTMGCGDECPLLPATHREDWNIPDPKLSPVNEFRSIRDLINKQVRDLLIRIQVAHGR